MNHGAILTPLLASLLNLTLPMTLTAQSEPSITWVRQIHADPSGQDNPELALDSQRKILNLIKERRSSSGDGLAVLQEGLVFFGATSEVPKDQEAQESPTEGRGLQDSQESEEVLLSKAVKAGCDATIVALHMGILSQDHLIQGGIREVDATGLPIVAMELKEQEERRVRYEAHAQKLNSIFMRAIEASQEARSSGADITQEDMDHYIKDILPVKVGVDQLENGTCQDLAHPLIRATLVWYEKTQPDTPVYQELVSLIGELNQQIAAWQRFQDNRRTNICAFLSRELIVGYMVRERIRTHKSQDILMVYGGAHSGLPWVLKQVWGLPDVDVVDFSKLSGALIGPDSYTIGQIRQAQDYLKEVQTEMQAKAEMAEGVDDDEVNALAWEIKTLGAVIEGVESYLARREEISAA